MGFPITDVITSIGNIVGKAIPDADKRMEVELEFAKLAQQNISEQVEVNKIEASNPNIFVSGWRPFIGWVGGVSLAYTFLAAPLFHLQALESGEILNLVYALLGVGTLRTVEKMAGVATAQAAPSSPDKPNIVQRTVSRWIK